MHSQDLTALGVPKHGSQREVFEVISLLRKQNVSLDEIKSQIEQVVKNPNQFEKDTVWSATAKAIITSRLIMPLSNPIDYKIWGNEIEESAIKQMDLACTLPVASKAALMSDAHAGYGLPIGGVLATENSIIPYAVGLDIACRLKLSVFDLPLGYLTGARDKVRNALIRETQFGAGGEFSKPYDHEVLDDNWYFSKITRDNKDKARRQLGTSGSGNHFVDIGELTFEEDGLLPKGNYFAIMSHSGSRGTGATVANYFSKLAMNLRPDLPPNLQKLAWLDLDTEEGNEYFEAMNLMGRYAHANHDLIHRNIAKNLGAKIVFTVENHHNFAWKEIHDGKEIIVHRKGATPASKGELGIIPGSMLEPAYLVRGLGNPASLNSASHGAGRKMSRRQAREKYTWSQVNKRLKERNVEVLSAGIDECPMAYKNIHEVMNSQLDLVEPLALFQPRMVRMASDGSREE